MPRSDVRAAGIYLRDLIIVLLIAVIGSGLGLTVYGARTSRLALSFFAGPLYLFFILAGVGLGYALNRHQSSKASLWVWILAVIWSVYSGARDMAHRGDGLMEYIWHTLIVGDREYALLSQWIIGAPFVSSLAYWFGAWLAARKHLTRTTTVIPTT